MKLLVIGLGSMGKRRVRNLKQLGVSDIIGYEPREDRRREAEGKYGIRTIGDWAEAEAAPRDAWVISTPPDTHLDYGFNALSRGVHFFTEANVTDSRAQKMVAALRAARTVGAPSCTMRYYFGPRKIADLVGRGAIGKPLMFTYHTGQYLPDWHPWESYKDFYVSKRATGACREIVPFELSWLVPIFGDVKALSAFRDKVTDLDCDIDDVYQILMRFSRGVSAHMVVDVVARPAFRVFRLNGSHGSIEWDHSTNRVRLWAPSPDKPHSYDLETIDLGQGTVEKNYIHAEEPYVHEMADFLAACRGEIVWPYSYEDDEAVLQLLLRAEKSSDTRTHQ